MRICLIIMMLISFYLLISSEPEVVSVSLDGTLYESWDYLPDSTGILVTQEFYVDSIFVGSQYDTLLTAEINDRVQNYYSVGKQLMNQKTELTDEYISKTNEIQKKLDEVESKLVNFWQPLQAGLKEE